MIYGAHVLLYSRDADADRQFLHEVLGFAGVDAGGGWLILALPPAEVAVHPEDEPVARHDGAHEMLAAHLYLMCDDLDATLAALVAKGVGHAAIGRERWGVRTTIRLPSGGELGLYQPLHPSPLSGSRA